jgi:N-acetylmuramoyl-L-alanine amidase
VLIDPGHSPKSPGTIGCNGKHEYLYNDALAKAVAAFLKRKNIPTDLTRLNNENISLIERAQKSNENCLLLSLHHDSVQPQFLYSKSNIRGYCSKKAKGFSIFVSRKNPHYNESVRYAEALGTALLKRGLIPTLHHAEPITGENREILMPDKGIYIYDELTILKNAKSPALLLEAAVIVHPQEALISDTDEYRRIISEAVYEMLANVK